MGISLTAVVTAALVVPLALTSPSTTDTGRGGPTPVHLGDLDRGDHPSIAFIRGRHLDFEVGDFAMVRPDGTTLSLPRAAWSAWTPMGPGAIGSFGAEGGPQVQVVGPTGRVTESTSYHYGLAVSPDRQITGWLVGRLNTPHVVEGGGTRAYDLPRIGHGLRIATIAGKQTCKELPPEGGGCTVFVNTAGDHGVWVAASHGYVDQLPARVRAVSDVAADSRILGLARDGHWALWGTRLHQRWAAPTGVQLTSFAPGGHAVLGLGPAGAKTDLRHVVSLYGDRGRLLASYTASGRDALTDFAWEDPTHVLATVFEKTGACPGPCRGRWAVVRLGVDGSEELALPPVAGVIDYAAYRLPLT